MRQQRQLTASRWKLAVLAVLAAAAAPAAEPAKETRPAWQRLLQREDARQAQELEEKVATLHEAGKFDDALKAAEAVVELRERVQGSNHWEAVQARWNAEAFRIVLRQGKERREAYRELPGLDRRSEELEKKAKYQEALPLREKALAICRKTLGESHPKTAWRYDSLAGNLNSQRRYAQAEAGYRKALAICRKTLGEEHPETAAGYNNVALNLNAQLKYAEAEEGLRKALAIRRKVLGEDDPQTAQGYNNLAYNLDYQEKYAEAETNYRKALDLNRKLRGENNFSLAVNYNNLATNLEAQGKYALAEPEHRKALAIFRKVRGENDSVTATSYNNLAYNQNYQGKYAQAEEGYLKALDIRRRVEGEDAPATAASHDNLAANRSAQGKYALAEEGFLKALRIRRKVFGDDHPSTALSYNNLAANHNAQGKHAQAEAGYRKALDIRRNALGEDSLQTAGGYNNLAASWNAQGKYAQAEGLIRKALAIYRKRLKDDHPNIARSYNNLARLHTALEKYDQADKGFCEALDRWRRSQGENHLETASTYNNLAFNRHSQGKYAQAEEGYRKALEIQLKILGKDHPDVAMSFNNLATNQDAQAKYALAEEGHRKALDIFQRVLGEDHPSTATTYDSLAYNQNAQGKYAEAESLLLKGARSFNASRLHLVASGLERAAKTGEASPLPRLAAVLARNGKPEEAWRWFEESLGRGLWDDLSARLRWPAADQAKRAELANRLDLLDGQIAKALAVKKPTAEQDGQRKDLLGQRLKVQEELAALGRRLEQAYGPVAGQVFERAAIQAALPGDAALVGWLDLAGRRQAADPNGEHWAVVLRSAGPPVWERLRGTGDRGAWTEDDDDLPGRVREGLASVPGTFREDLPDLRRRLVEQRFKPLEKHLAGVRQLIVLPSQALAGLPVEAIVDGLTVSYAPSGTLYAHLRKQPPCTAQGLLALADPVFQQADVTATPSPPLPKGGVLLTLVFPGSNAAQSGLKAGDVLLRYGGKDLAGPPDLKPLPESDDAKARVPITIWREGKTLEMQLRPGRLGVLMAEEPAAAALAERRKIDSWLASTTRSAVDDKWQPLPGTRVELAALRQLFESALVMADSQASEQQLDRLAERGELGKYRYLHLATHGTVDDRFPLRSAVILARDNLPDVDKQLDAGLYPYDGRLTAEEVLRRWNLRSELVTLSACRTALGKYERGEGHVGFAQALLLAGSRSVCLSLWKVDDTATALLMSRFYENLLGQRPGLDKPLGKAAALAEAKAWLRGLSREEAARRSQELAAGVERGKGRTTLPPLPEALETIDDRPYAHPNYWAAFVLIGDSE